jgi:hypothetical protein
MFQALVGAKKYAFTVTMGAHGVIDEERNLTKKETTYKVVVMAYDLNDAEKQAFKQYDKALRSGDFSVYKHAWSTAVLAVEYGGEYVVPCNCKCKCK